MDLALVISVISICGFAGALSYNVYEFRKVGKSLDRINQSLENSRKEHEGMIQALNRINESLLKISRKGK